jgi:hypothetical protein
VNKYPLISENIDPMYKFSLPWFVKIYHREEGDEENTSLAKFYMDNITS